METPRYTYKLCPAPWLPLKLCTHKENSREPREKQQLEDWERREETSAAAYGKVNRVKFQSNQVSSLQRKITEPDSLYNIIYNDYSDQYPNKNYKTCKKKQKWKRKTWPIIRQKTLIESNPEVTQILELAARLLKYLL